MESNRWMQPPWAHAWPPPSAPLARTFAAPHALRWRGNWPPSARGRRRRFVRVLGALTLIMTLAFAAVMAVRHGGLFAVALAVLLVLHTLGWAFTRRRRRYHRLMHDTLMHHAHTFRHTIPLARDPRELEFEARCARVLDAVHAAPDAVKGLLTTPEQTVEAIRLRGLELLTQERALRAEADQDALRRLDAEREQLVQRHAQSDDPPTQERLQGALEALDGQRAQQGLLRRHAERLEAERTRLSYGLDGLHAQLVRAQATRAADADPVCERVEALRDEVSAFADALEEVHVELRASKG